MRVPSVILSSPLSAGHVPSLPGDTRCPGDCSSHASSVPPRARDMRRVLLPCLYSSQALSTLPVHPQPARWWPKSRPCPRFPGLLRQVTPPSPYPALRREPVGTCAFCLGSPGCCPPAGEQVLRSTFPGTAPGRVAQHTPAELNLKRRASRPRGRLLKRTRTSSAP